MMKPIKFVYFDVGGVVIRDFSGTDQWSKLKAELGLKPDAEERFHEVWHPIEREVVVGRDLESAVPILRDEFKLNIPENYSLLRRFITGFEANKAIWPIIERVQQKVPTGLLTNMYPSMLAAIEEAGLLPEVQWDVIVDSSEVKLKKPDAAIFELATEQAGVAAENILFIDNTPGHIEAAKQFGWQTFHYDSDDYTGSAERLAEFLKGVL
jgi:putative hydrolase of the HAD superfamily